MALGDPNIDPLVEQQLYGPDPALADGSPAPHEDPWAWVPPAWDASAPVDPTADLAHLQAPPPGTAPATAASFAPPAPAMPGSQPPGQPPDPALPPPVDSDLAGNPALPPADAAAPPDPFAPPPPPDALSDVGGMPASGDIGGIPYEPTRTPDQLPRAADRAVQAGLSASPFDEAGNFNAPQTPEGRASLQRWLANPNNRADAEAKLDDLKAKHFIAEQQRIVNENYDREQAMYAMRLEATRVAQAKADAIAADAQRLADTKIDPTGGISVGQGIAGVLAAAMGGLVRGRTGSNVNPGMDALDSVINRGIEVQKANLANKREGLAARRSALADEYARTGNLDHAADVVRIAALKHAEDLLSIQQLDYARGGTTDLKIAAQKAAIAQAQAQAMAGITQKNYDNSLKLQDAARQQEIADETRRKNREDAYLRAQELANARADRKDAQVARADEKATERADKEAERDRQFAIGGVDGADLRNPDNTVWRVADPQVRKDLGDKITAAKSLVKLYDRALAIRDRVGGESGLFNSPDRQELEQIEAEVKILRKQGTQGMSSDEDMQNLAQAGGAKDIASFRSRSPGIEIARARLQDQLNDALKTARYRGPAITFPKAPATKNTADEDATQNLLQAPSTSVGNEFEAAIAKRTLGLSPDESRALAVKPGEWTRDTLNPQQRAILDEVARTYDPSASIDQQHQIADLGIAAAGTSPDALAAAAKLQRVATDAHTTRLRELARQALQSAQAAGLHGEPAAPGQDLGVSYETVPPAPARGGR